MVTILELAEAILEDYLGHVDGDYECGYFCEHCGACGPDDKAIYDRSEAIRTISHKPDCVVALAERALAENT